MMKKIITIGIVTMLFTLFFYILCNSKSIIDIVLFSVSIWKDNLFPTLFPFLLLSNILIHMGFIDFLSEIFKGINSKLFYLPGSSSFVIIMSLLTGFPSSGKYINQLLVTDKIDEDDANYLLMFTHFSNPLFVIGTIGTIFLGNAFLGFIILLCHIISNFIIAFIFRRKKVIKKEKISIKKAFNYIKFDNNISSILSDSIFNAINTMFLLLGIITLFLIFSILLNDLLYLPSNSSIYLFGLLEMTQGIKYSSLLNTNLLNKSILMLSFISFGGFSVHMQVFSFFENKKIKYKYFLFSRLLQVIISIILLILIFYIFNIN